jgi:hypothetical protein
MKVEKVFWGKVGTYLSGMGTIEYPELFGCKDPKTEFGRFT